MEIVNNTNINSFNNQLLVQHIVNANESKLKAQIEMNENLKCVISDKDKEIQFLKYKITELMSMQTLISNMESFMNQQLYVSQSLEKEVSEGIDRLDSVYNESKSKYELEILQLKSTIDFMHKRLENTVILEAKLSDSEKKMENNTKMVSELIDKMTNESRKQKLDFAFELEEIKNVLNNNIEKDKKKYVDNSLSHLKITEKLSLIQNNHLIADIEYKSKYINYSQDKIESLERKIWELNNEIILHKNIENDLMRKNKSLLKNLDDFKLNVKLLLADYISNDEKDLGKINSLKEYLGEILDKKESLCHIIINKNKKLSKKNKNDSSLLSDNVNNSNLNKSNDKINIKTSLNLNNEKEKSKIKRNKDDKNFGNNDNKKVKLILPKLTLKNNNIFTEGNSVSSSLIPLSTIKNTSSKSFKMNINSSSKKILKTKT